MLVSTGVLRYRSSRPAVCSGEAIPLAARLTTRRGHFFPAKLLENQLGDLEMPDHDERTIAVPAVRPAGQIADEIIRRLDLTPASQGGLPWGPGQG